MLNVGKVKVPLAPVESYMVIVSPALTVAVLVGVLPSTETVAGFEVSPGAFTFIVNAEPKIVNTSPSLSSIQCKGDDNHRRLSAKVHHIRSVHHVPDANRSE